MQSFILLFRNMKIHRTTTSFSKSGITTEFITYVVGDANIEQKMLHEIATIERASRAARTRRRRQSEFVSPFKRAGNMNLRMDIIMLGRRRSYGSENMGRTTARPEQQYEPVVRRPCSEAPGDIELVPLPAPPSIPVFL